MRLTNHARAKIRVFQLDKETLKSEYELADLRSSGATQKEIYKQQVKVKKFATDFAKSRGDYNRRYPSERFVTDRQY